MKTSMTLKEIELPKDIHLIRQKGISLIELLVVIALVGVMATWSAQRLWQHQRMESPNSTIRVAVVEDDGACRTALAQACFDFLPTRAQLDLLGWGDEKDIFHH